MFMTPGAEEVVLRLVSLGGEVAIPPMAESTFVRSEVSADMMTGLRWGLKVFQE